MRKLIADGADLEHLARRQPFAALRDNPPQAVLDAIADCPRGVEVTGDYESICIRPLLIWQAALDALVTAR